MHRTEHEFHSYPSVWTPDPLVRSVEWKESEVAWSCPTLCDPMDCSLPGFSIHGIFQARAMGFSRQGTGVGCHFLLQEIFPTQDRAQGPCIASRSFYRLSQQGSQWSRLSPFNCIWQPLAIWGGPSYSKGIRNF